MLKSKVASWVVVGALIVGGGAALAETAPAGPELGEVDGDGTVAPATAPAPAPAPADDTGDGDGELTPAPAPDASEGDEAGKHPDNHGAVVSAAAKDHQYDEACGNHGKVVSAVAKTGQLPECATAGGTDATPDAKGKGKAKKAAKAKKK